MTKQIKEQSLNQGKFVSVYDKSLVTCLNVKGVIICEQTESCFLCHLATLKEEILYQKKLGYENTESGYQKLLKEEKVIWI